MKTRIKKRFGMKWTILMIMIFSAFCFAQFEDNESNEQDTIVCIPDTLTTVYDQFKQTDLNETDLKMWYSFGSEYYKQGEYKNAIPYLWKVFVNDTSKMGELSIRKVADSYFKLQYADSTLLACYRGLERYPDLLTLHYYAGILQANLGKNECAIPHYEFLVNNNPKVESYLDKLAFLYYKVEDERAIDVQKKLVALAPDNADYQLRLVLYMEHFGFDPLDDLRLAFKNNPNDMNIAKQLAKAELNGGNYKKSAELYSILLKNDPNQKGILKLRAQSYEGLLDYKAAIDDYKSILKIKPDDLEALCAIATDYKFMNKFAEGRSWVNKAIASNPKSGLPHIVMAEIYEAAVPYSQSVEKRGRKIDDGFVYERAIEEYEKAKKDPTYTAYANQRIKLLEPLLPTQEELFFAQGDTKLKCKSYTSWIDGQ